MSYGYLGRSTLLLREALRSLSGEIAIECRNQLVPKKRIQNRKIHAFV